MELGKKLTLSFEYFYCGVNQVRPTRSWRDACGSYVNSIGISAKLQNFVPIVHHECRGPTYTLDATLLFAVKQ